MPYIAAIALLSSLQGDSPIQDDEVVVFFPALARPIGSGERPDWEILIRGWIFEPETDSLGRKAALGVLREALGLEPGSEETSMFVERARHFLVDNERGKEVSIQLGDKSYALGTSRPSGHFISALRLGDEEIRALRRRGDRLETTIRFQAVTRKDDPRVFAGEITFIEGPGISVVSDIDDTIKVSEVRDRKALLSNTFLRKYESVPGMSEAFRRLARRGAAFHYVSASPWQLYAPLSAFTRDAGFPAGSFHLKEFRVKDSSFFNLFESPLEYKLSVLEPLLDAFPARRFVLIGDSTEKDPEAYGELARRLGDRVELILIRQVAGSELSEERAREAFRGIPPATWRTFRDPAEILPLVSGR